MKAIYLAILFQQSVGKERAVQTPTNPHPGYAPQSSSSYSGGGNSGYSVYDDTYRGHGVRGHGVARDSRQGNHGYSAGGNQGYSASGHQGYSAGGHQGYSVGGRQGYSAGGQQGYSVGGGGGYYTGGHQGYFAGGNQGYSAGGQGGYSGGGNQGYSEGGSGGSSGNNALMTFLLGNLAGSSGGSHTHAGGLLDHTHPFGSQSGSVVGGSESPDMTSIFAALLGLGTKHEHYPVRASAEIGKGGYEDPNECRGTITVVQTSDDKATVTYDIKDCPDKGKHSLFVHEDDIPSSTTLKGDCREAGDRYNPENDSEGQFIGDLGNITVDDDGNASGEITSTKIKLRGKTSIVDRSFVLYKTDDDGASDDRQACGSILDGVDCGGHRASSCSACPDGNGKDWCNGECEWTSGKCVHSGGNVSSSSGSVSSGGELMEMVKMLILRMLLMRLIGSKKERRARNTSKILREKPPTRQYGNSGFRHRGSRRFQGPPMNGGFDSAPWGNNFPPNDFPMDSNFGFGPPMNAGYNSAPSGNNYPPNDFPMDSNSGFGPPMNGGFDYGY